MANQLLTPSVIGREALMILENQLVAASLFHRGHTEEFTGAKRGDTITIRGPATFTAQEFEGSIVVQDAAESSVPLTLEKHVDVSFAVTSKDWSLEVADFSEQLLRPAVVAIAQKVDAYILSKLADIPNWVGTAGDPPDSLADLAAVDKALNDLKVPMDGRIAIVNPAAKADMLGISAIVEADKRGDGGMALRNASMGHVMGLDWYMSQNIPSHDTDGPTSWQVNQSGGAAAGATSFPIDTGSNSPKDGDVFTVAGDTVQHVVESYSGGTLTFAPALGSGVDDDAALTFVTTDHAINVAGHPNGLTAAIVPLELPRGAARAQYIGDRGLGIRVVFDYDTNTKKDTISLDLLVGAKVQQSDLLTRVLG